MKKLTLLSLSLLLLCTATMEAAPHEKSNLRILYVGGTAEFETTGRGNFDPEAIRESVAKRMKSFETFLNEYFTHVTVIHADDYTQDLSDRYDVTVMDGVPRVLTPDYSDNFRRSRGTGLVPGYLDQDFSRPMLTIGMMSDVLGRRIGTKNNNSCHCLYSYAHHWRAEHPIFKGPFDVTMTVEDRPTPEELFSYPLFFDGGITPDQLPMWQVQTYDLRGAESGQQRRVGIISGGWGGYEDCPDAEFISGGVSTKNQTSVAIGRHGNFFHWGFAASPNDMTEEAKTVLANSIVYVSKFAEQTPIARQYYSRSSRESVKNRTQYASHGAFERNLRSITRSNENTLKTQEELRARQARGETLNEREERTLSQPLQELPTYERHLQRREPELFAKYGMDLDAYKRFIDENYNFFYNPEEDFGFVLRIDEDAKSLGIPNNDHRILDEAIKLLETGKDTDKAKRILTRYTLVDFNTSAEWRRWYNTNKDKLFFTEAGGYYFLINSRDAGANDYKGREIRVFPNRMTISETNLQEPVAVAAEVTTLQDGTRMLFIKLNVHPGHHIYNDVASGDIYIATEIEVSLPDGFSKKGNLKRPFGEFHNERGTTIFRNTLVFSQEFTGNGRGEVKLAVTYQCCDSNICLPPETKEFTVVL